jgi:hypothetical protein
MYNQTLNLYVCGSDQEIPSYLFITVFTRIQSSFSHFISVRSILILSSHIWLSTKWSISIRGSEEDFMPVLYVPFAFYTHLILDLITRRVQIV